MLTAKEAQEKSRKVFSELHRSALGELEGAIERAVEKAVAEGNSVAVVNAGVHSGPLGEAAEEICMRLKEIGYRATADTRPVDGAFCCFVRVDWVDFDALRESIKK